MGIDAPIQIALMKRGQSSRRIQRIAREKERDRGKNTEKCVILKKILKAWG